MKIAAHVFRRGAVYAWRRRIPLSCSSFPVNSYIQISMITRDPQIARKIGAILHCESERVFELMSDTSLNKEDAKAWLEYVVSEELDRIQRRRIIELDSSVLGSHDDNRLTDELATHCYRLLFEKGFGAKFDPESDAAIAKHGYPQKSLQRGKDMLEVFRQDFQSDSRHAKVRKMYGDVLGLSDMGAVRYLELRRLLLKGKAIAYTASLEQDDSSLTAGVAAVEAELRRSAQGDAELFTKAPALIETSPKEVSQNVRKASAEGAEFSSDFAEIIDRVIKKKRREGTKEKTIRQILQITGVFLEITGVDDVTDLRQGHIAKYVDTLAELPKSYRKSPKDREKSISEILTDAKSLPAEKKGLAINTINRNLTFVSDVIKRARSEGHEISNGIDLTGLKPRRNKRTRDERPPFTFEDVQNIFRNPLWTGCRSQVRRREPGNRLIRDGRYWVPLIGALSGARREEISALSAMDIVQVKDTWCFHFRENENRGLKNLQSERFVPIHSQLIELGLLEFAEKRKKLKGDMFEELRPKSDLTSYGDQIDHLFRLIVQQQVDDHLRKTFHSLRHYVTDVFNNSMSVKHECRDDILGHLGASLGSSRYGSGTNIENLTNAIEALPWISTLRTRSQ